MNYSSASSYIVPQAFGIGYPALAACMSLPLMSVMSTDGSFHLFVHSFIVFLLLIVPYPAVCSWHRDADKPEEEEKPRGNGTMWAQFPGDFKSPLRPKSAQEFEEQGYRRAHEGVQIMRDKAIFEKKRLVLEEYHNLLYVSTHAPCLARCISQILFSVSFHLLFCQVLAIHTFFLLVCVFGPCMYVCIFISFIVIGRQELLDAANPSAPKKEKKKKEKGEKKKKK